MASFRQRIVIASGDLRIRDSVIGTDIPNTRMTLLDQDAGSPAMPRVTVIQRDTAVFLNPGKMRLISTMPGICFINEASPHPESFWRVPLNAAQR